MLWRFFIVYFMRMIEFMISKQNSKNEPNVIFIFMESGPPAVETSL